MMAGFSYGFFFMGTSEQADSRARDV